MNPFFIDFKL
jgi:hypothetical protein